MIRDQIKKLVISGMYATPINTKYEILKHKFLELIPEARQSFKLNCFEQFKGRYFNSNLMIWLVIRSALYTHNINLQFFDVIKKSFSKNEMIYIINKALNHCACRDYYYAYEKRYD